MNDFFLYVAGSLGLVISIIHGYLGETKVIQPIQTSSVVGKRVLSAIMFLSAVYWGIASLILLAAPTQFPEAARTVIVLGVAAVYLSGSLANLWATRGSHFGWILLALATGLTVAGL